MCLRQMTFICLFLLRCLWFLCKNMQEGVCGLLMCVCEGDVTHGGHSSGQHQLSECEVQPQAKASLACRDKPDPPHPPTYTHTYILDQNQKQPPLTLTFLLQRVHSKAVHSAHSSGTSPRFRLGLCTTRHCIH